MFGSHKSLQSVAAVLIFMLASVICQDNERRAVTEHQLMHDRGRAIQSLRRLIWLTSTMEGLHTAHSRIPPDAVPPDCQREYPEQPLAQLGRANSTPKTLWDVFPGPPLTGLPR
uniref:Parathyroid hormone 4 n=1 Tax=Paramormyrops kingsleyae TaxID=1676925 RepID=A0A3B3R9K5_9TELE